jgi:hypothetical protein
MERTIEKIVIYCRVAAPQLEKDESPARNINESISGFSQAFAEQVDINARADRPQDGVK